MSKWTTLGNMSVLANFSGIMYRLPDNWFSVLNVIEYKEKPIKYLEIGAFYGANLLAVTETFGAHEESKLFCIDPWEDYNDYPEYKNQMKSIYDTFLENVEKAGKASKINVLRGYSNAIVPTLEDNFFDLIYIDGNHEPEYVLEDAVLSFRKLKVGGIMIFDDYGWGGPLMTKKGIDAFLGGYHKRIEFLGEKNTQVFIKKLR